jgi:hypothetical protein
MIPRLAIDDAVNSVFVDAVLLGNIGIGGVDGQPADIQDIALSEHRQM